MRGIRAETNENTPDEAKVVDALTGAKSTHMESESWIKDLGFMFGLIGRKISLLFGALLCPPSLAPEWALRRDRSFEVNALGAFTTSVLIEPPRCAVAAAHQGFANEAANTINSSVPQLQCPAIHAPKGNPRRRELPDYTYPDIKKE